MYLVIRPDSDSDLLFVLQSDNIFSVVVEHLHYLSFYGFGCQAGRMFIAGCHIKQRLWSGGPSDPFEGKP